MVNDEPAVPRPTTPPPRARNASSAARLGAVSVAGFSVPPTTSTSTSAVSVVDSVVAVAARPLEAERTERVAHLGAADVGDHDLDRAPLQEPAPP